LIESVNLGFVATPAQLEEVIAREGLDPSFRPVLGRLLFVYRNLNDVVTEGVEIDGEIALSRAFTLGGAYAGLDARDRARGIDLTGRHAHQGHVRLAWQLDRIGLRANVRGTFYSDWVAARTTAADGAIRDTRAPGFALWDAYVSQRVLRNLTGFVSLENLADSRDPNTGVLLPSGAPAAISRPEVGRTVRVGLRWAWAAN
jgi:outer membrane receptor protein involved in Fe transport